MGLRTAQTADHSTKALPCICFYSRMFLKKKQRNNSVCKDYCFSNDERLLSHLARWLARMSIGDFLRRES